MGHGHITTLLMPLMCAIPRKYARARLGLRLGLPRRPRRNHGGNILWRADQVPDLNIEMRGVAPGTGCSSN